MKKRYITKSQMAQDLSEVLKISFEDAKSRLSRNPKPITEFQLIEIEGETHDLKFYLTPLKYL
jgi:hypothetical protein